MKLEVGVPKCYVKEARLSIVSMELKDCSSSISNDFFA
jgi:hypothetical protein